MLDAGKAAAFVVACAILFGTAAATAQELTVTNARILTADGSITHGSLFIRDGRILDISANAAAAPVGTVIDAKGMTAMPGRIDAHRHLTLGLNVREEMQALLAAGFTTILNGGGNPERQIAVRDQIEAGTLAGPRIIVSGPTGFVANLTPEAAREDIRRLAALGVKYTGEMLLTPLPGPGDQEVATLRAMLEEGERQGVTVQVHAVSTPAMLAAVRAGVKHLVHMPNKDWIEAQQAQEVAASGAHVLMAIGFGSPVFGVFAEDNHPRFRDGKPWPTGIIDGVGGGKEAGYSMVNSRTLFDAGVPVGNGMDTSYDPLAGLAHELRSMNVVFSPRDMVQVMGPNTAGYLGMQEQIGSLAPGRIADVVLVAGDPLSGYWNWLDVRAVIKDGRVEYTAEDSRQ